MEEPLAFVSLPYGVTPCTYEVGKSRCYKADESNMSSAMGLGIDAFQIDDLLDFSNDDIAGPMAGFQLSGHSIVSSLTDSAGLDETSNSSAKASCQSNPSCKSPHEDHLVGMDFEIAELDWLSKFVEDSYSTGEHLKLDTITSFMSDDKQKVEASADTDRSNGTSSVSFLENGYTSTESLLSETYIPGRARSKRCRSGMRIWSSKILASPLSQESSTCDPTEICFFSSSESAELYSNIYSADSQGFRSEQEQVPGLEAEKMETKPPKCKKWRLKDSSMQNRRCTHCLSQRTPQWRAGPLGPKTLCNACGVRYKSGRLFPEYRPAASPTFLSDVHSNSHRKVMQIRREKETTLHQNSTDLVAETQRHCSSPLD